MRDHTDIEQRLRTAFRTVAELPRPEGTVSHPTADPGRPRSFVPGARRRRVLATVVSVAAVIAVVSLVLAYGPHNGQGPASHPKVPSSQRTITVVPPPSTTTPSSTAVGTQQITYNPFVGSKVDPSLHVIGSESGPCFEYGGGGDGDGRDYYRCVGTPDVMQPCFAGPDGTSAPLVCPAQSVTENDIVMWTAASVHTSSFVPATTKTPWAMQLSNGTVCEFVSAAWSGLGPYGCGTADTATATPADCRQPQTGTPYWTAECQAQETQASPFTSTSVEKVWF